MRHLHGRRRVFRPARAFENVAPLDLVAAQVAGLARDAHQALGAIVIRLEFVVSNGPVAHVAIFRQPLTPVLFDDMRETAEIVRVIAVRDAAPVLPRAANTGAGKKRTIMPDGQSALARGVAKGYRFISNGLH